MSRPRGGRRPYRAPKERVNGRIRAREVRLLSDDGKQLGVFSIQEAMRKAKEQQLDLVEISPNAKPPVCRITDYGKYSYDQKRLRKEQKKATVTVKIKEIQLRPNIDPHDFTFKLNHAIDFLCEGMKVKVILRFRGKELRTKHIGLQTIEAFIDKIKQWGSCDTKPREAGRSVIVLINPLSKNVRAPHPNPEERMKDVDYDDIRHVDGADVKKRGSGFRNKALDDIKLPAKN
ncbi:MAG: translation initiation factor IF-3 [Verrucomicrobiales bacterium]|nr:translation initiation factor IF-3 [Verrucomicrobiales bacterium]